MTLTSFKLATLNVHQWEDAGGVDNVDRVQHLVKRHDPDILCLQETTREGQSRFMSGTNFVQDAKSMDGIWIKFGGCSVITRFPLEVTCEAKSHRNRVRRVTSKIQLPNSKEIYVTSLHLDHRLEPHRLQEEEILYQSTKDLFDRDAPQIWTGDFNALTKEDYPPDAWNQITQVRQRNMWELPKTDLTTKVKSRGFIDCWEKMKRPEPIKTCRFDTRIDYIFATPSFLSQHQLLNIQHIDDPASDHNMAIAQFQL